MTLLPLRGSTGRFENAGHIKTRALSSAGTDAFESRRIDAQCLRSHASIPPSRFPSN
jgi:hypothetical protein